MSTVYRSSSQSSNHSSHQSPHRNNRSSSGTGVLVGLFVVVMIVEGVVAIFATISGILSVLFVGLGPLLNGILTTGFFGLLVGGSVLIFRMIGKWSLAGVPAVFVVLWYFLPLGLILVIALGVSGILVIYWIGHRLLNSRGLAIAICALPLIGGFFYVPSLLSGNELILQIYPETTVSTVPAERANSLLQINGVATKASSTDRTRTAVISYQVRDNHLFADFVRDGSVESIRLNTASMVQTPLTWLQYDLSKRLPRYFGREESGPAETSETSLKNVVAPVNATLAGYDRIIVADGALLDYPQAQVLDNKRVFRSVSMDSQTIARNLTGWGRQEYLSAESVRIINGLPTTPEEVRRLGLSDDAVSEWRTVQKKFNDAVPHTLAKTISSGSNSTKDSFLKGLADLPNILVIVAHSDGFSIQLPNGDAVTINDLKSVAKSIRSNHPRVFFFSCETALIKADQSFAKTLLDYGAEVVIAPVTKITASEALSVFSRFVALGTGPKPLSISKAFERALSEVCHGNLEIWIARETDSSTGRAVEI